MVRSRMNHLYRGCATKMSVQKIFLLFIIEHEDSYAQEATHTYNK